MESTPLPIVLDFTEKGSLPAELLRRLDDLAEEQRENFNGLLAELSLGRERNIDWWVSRPASRNTHISVLFSQCMQLALVHALIEEGKSPVVRTDSAPMARVLRSVLGREKVYLTGLCSFFWRVFRGALWDIGSTLFHTTGALYAARRTQNLAPPRGSVPMSVLGTYAYRDSFENGEFRDFHYPSLFENCDESQRARLHYFPVFYRIRDYETLFRDLRTSNRNFLICEDYLHLSDYLFTLGHWWRAKRLAGRHANFAGFDVGPLVDAELRLGSFANSTAQALLHYRFWCAAAARGVSIERLVDWYEGHDIAHATAAAFNWCGLGPPLAAYRPVAPPNYLSVTPARHEVASGVVPYIWAVIGSDVRTKIARANPELTVLPAPGLRFGRLRSFERRSQGVAQPIVLVLLSTEPDLIERLFAVIAPVLRASSGYRWIVKRHPACPEEETAAVFGSLASSVEFVDGDIYDWLAIASAVIGLGTNTLMEAVVAGVPVICVTGGNSPTEVPLPRAFKAGWWRTCYGSSELATVLPQALEVAWQPNPSAERMDALLGPLDVEALRKLLFDELPDGG